MADVVMIRPQDDLSARYASDWADQAISVLSVAGHAIVADIDQRSPADTAAILAAIGNGSPLVCYFGHGDDGSWLTNSIATVDATTVEAAAGKCVISVACLTARSLGPDAINSGVLAWLGFTILVPVFAPHRNHYPIGEAIAESLAVLGAGGTMEELRSEIVRQLYDLSDEFDHGSLAHHPAKGIGYYGSLALADHVVVNGATTVMPLA